MAEIGINSSAPTGVVRPDIPATRRDPSGVLGKNAGLGETNSVVPPDANRTAPSESGGTSTELTEDQQRQLDELKRRDQEVRRHEQAHLAAAGRYANGGPQYEFTTGPDGRQYATGGHVNIDTGPAETPEATLAKARIIRRAALAPADPSAQDRAVANAANQLERDARQQIQQARKAELEQGQPPNPLAPPPETEYSSRPGGIAVERLDLRA